MKDAMIDDTPGKPALFATLHARLAPRLRGTLPAAGLIGACLITLAWWLVVAHGLWAAYEWALA